MNRLIIVGVTCAAVGFAVGSTFGPAGSVDAQSQLSARRPPEPTLAPDQPAKAIHWPLEDLKRSHAELLKRAAARQSTNGVNDLIPMPFARTHGMKLNHRPHGMNAGVEQHAGVTDFYVVVGGSATVTVGGTIKDRSDVSGMPGEYRGPSIISGDTYQLKTGDWLMIPPGVPHMQVPGDEGFSYMMMKINVGLYPWSQIAGMNTNSQQQLGTSADER